MFSFSFKIPLQITVIFTIFTNIQVSIKLIQKVLEQKKIKSEICVSKKYIKQ